MESTEPSSRRHQGGEKSRTASPGGGVQSLTRALSILDALSGSDDGLTLTTLARQVALPPSSAHRLLTTMQRQRFVRFDPATMCWQIGVQAFLVGNAFARTRDVATLARPYMRRLMEEVGETVNLYVLSGGETVVCMAQVQCDQTIRAISRPGGQVGMHGSAAGKAMLAHMTRQEVADIARKRGLARKTANTIGSLRKLHAELGRIRERGFSIDDEEFAIGLRCVAAPIFDERGAAHAALSVAGPTARMFDDRIAILGGVVGAAARAVTTELGGTTGRPQSLAGRGSAADDRHGAVCCRALSIEVRPMHPHTFLCIDAHTCGNPVRVVAGGAPPLPEVSMAERRQIFLKEHDWIRTALMFEPRGHDAMSGSILYPPSRPDCDLGVLFIEVSGCLPMCGHGTIGTVTVALEQGFVTPRSEGKLSLEVPAGRVEVEYESDGRFVDRVRLFNIASYLHAADVGVEVPGLGELTVDVAYGGNYYAIVEPQKNWSGLDA